MFLRVGTARTIVMGPFVDDTDGKTAETGLTIAQADIRISKNGGAFAQTNNTAGATHMENGYYSVPLDATDTAAPAVSLRVCISKAGALPVYREFMVYIASAYDYLTAGTDLMQVDVVQVTNSAAYGTALADFLATGYNAVTHKVAGVVLVDTATTAAAVTGTVNANVVQVNAAAVSLSSLTEASIKTAVEAAGSSLATLITNLATANAGITTMKGVDGVTLATLQANYAPNKTVPPTTAQIKTAIEAAGSSLATLLTNLATVNGYVDELEARLTATRAAYLDKLNITGNVASATALALTRSISYLGDFAAGSIFTFVFNIPGLTAVGSPAVYKDGNLVQRHGGISAALLYDGSVDMQSFTVDLTETAYFTPGTGYSIVLLAATVYGQSQHVVLGHFSIEKRYTRGTDNAALAASATSAVDWTPARAAYLDKLNITGNVAGASGLSDLTGNVGTPEDLGTGSTIAAMLRDMAGQTFSMLSDSQENLRDRGDAAWLTGGDATAANQYTIIANIAAVPTVAEILEGVVDGAIDVKTALRRILAVTTNACVVSLADPNVLAYRNSADAATVVTHTIPSSGESRSVEF